MEQVVADLIDTFIGGFKYTLRTLPDIIISGTALMALLLQSTPLTYLLAGLILNAGTTGLAANFLLENVPKTAKVGGLVGAGTDLCSGHFPGVSWNRLGSLMAYPGAILEGSVPSYYASTIGFLLAYTQMLPSFYRDELKMLPGLSARLTGSLVASMLMFAMVVVYRIASECEAAWVTLASLLFGATVGYLYITLVAQATDRRGSNIFSIPLLRGKAADSQPIYVCAKEKDI